MFSSVQKSEKGGFSICWPPQMAPWLLKLEGCLRFWLVNFPLYTLLMSLNPQHPISIFWVLNEVSLPLQDVATLSSKLEVHSSMDPDSSHPLILHSCPSIIEPFCTLFKHLLSYDSSPAAWKKIFHCSHINKRVPLHSFKLQAHQP